MTGMSHLKKAENRLRTCEDCAFRREGFILYNYLITTIMYILLIQQFC